MDKHQLIEQIRRLNPTAAESLLTRSDENDLSNYLFRLRIAGGPRTPESTWARPGNTPAVVMRECRPGT